MRSKSQVSREQVCEGEWSLRRVYTTGEERMFTYFSGIYAQFFLPRKEARLRNLVELKQQEINPKGEYGYAKRNFINLKNKS